MCWLATCVAWSYLLLVDMLEGGVLLGCSILLICRRLQLPFLRLVAMRWAVGEVIVHLF